MTHSTEMLAKFNDHIAMHRPASPVEQYFACNTFICLQTHILKPLQAYLMLAMLARGKQCCPAPACHPPPPPLVRRAARRLCELLPSDYSSKVFWHCMQEMKDALQTTADENGRLHERLASEGRKHGSLQDELASARCGFH